MARERKRDDLRHPPSEDGDRASDLAALQAHFMESFGSDALQVPPATPKDDIDAARKEEVRRGKKKANEGSKPKLERASKHKAPETVVFEEGGIGRGRSGDDEASSDSRRRWRDFMSTKAANSGPDSFSSAGEYLRTKVAERQQRERDAAGDSDEDGETEAQQVTNDRQLSQLLNTTLFAKGSGSKGSSDNAKPDLSSHDTLSRILDLSSSSIARKGQTFGRGHGEKALRADQLSKMPSKMRQGIRAAAGERAEKDVDRKRELGLLNSAYSRKLNGIQEADATMTGRRKAERDRVRGLSMGVGRFKNGTLKLSKDEVNKIVGDGPERKRPGGGRGGGGGGGGNKRRKT